VITIEESSRSVDAFIISREKSEERNSFARARKIFSSRLQHTFAGNFPLFLSQKEELSHPIIISITTTEKNNWT